MNFFSWEGWDSLKEDCVTCSWSISFKEAKVCWREPANSATRASKRAASLSSFSLRTTALCVESAIKNQPRPIPLDKEERLTWQGRASSVTSSKKERGKTGEEEKRDLGMKTHEDLQKMGIPRVDSHIYWDKRGIQCHTMINPLFYNRNSYL